MKYNFLLFIVFSVLCGCNNKPAAATDPQQNRYFRLYNEIYNQWDKVPADSTQQKLDAYLQEFPENADAQMLAGNLAYWRADYEKAIAHNRAAIALQPGQAVYYSALGTVYNVQNKIDSAEKYLLKAVELKDSSLYTFLNISILYLKKQDKEKSFAFADSAYAKGSFSSAVCCGLSFVYHGWNDGEKSRDYFERAVAAGLKDTTAFKEVLAGKLKLEDFYRKN